MDIEKLIEQLRWWAENCDRSNYGCHARPFLLDAATAFSTIQAENEKLRADVVRFNDMLSSYQNVLVSELRAELEQVKAERDAAIKDIWVPKWISCKNGENCSFVSAITGMPDCAGCDNWEWRGQKED